MTVKEVLVSENSERLQGVCSVLERMKDFGGGKKHPPKNNCARGFDPPEFTELTMLSASQFFGPTTELSSQTWSRTRQLAVMALSSLPTASLVVCCQLDPNWVCYSATGHIEDLAQSTVTVTSLYRGVGPWTVWRMCWLLFPVSVKPVTG